MRNKIVVIGIIVIAAFYFFSGYVKRGGLKDVDFATTIKIQERIDKSSRLRFTDIVGNIMEGVTLFASPEFSIVAVLVLTSVAFIKAKGKKRKVMSLVIPLAFALLVLGELYGKSVVHHPAPPYFMIKNPTTIFPKYYINDQYSYPSGHTARAVFIAMLIIQLSIMHVPLSTNLLGKKRTWIIVGIASAYVLLVAVSRIYLGHHWLSDVMGGMFLGSGLSLVVFIFL